MAKTVLPDGSSKYDGGGYTVVIKTDGAISVQSGDSLSKYSMAIHGNFDHINEFKHRRNKPTGPITDADLGEIPNVNLIHVGEILYHIPTRKDDPGNGIKPKPKPVNNIISKEQFLRMRHFPRTQIPMRDFGNLKAGQGWLTKEGRKTIVSIHTASAAIIYLLENPASPYNNQLIIQTVTGFKDDIREYFYDDLRKRTEPIKRIVEFEVALMLGLVSCANFPAFIAVTGVMTLEWLINNRAWLGKVNDAIYITCRTRQYLKTYAPTLYDKLIYATLHHLWKSVPNVAGNVPEAILKDPKLVGGGTGVILGHLTFYVSKGRFAAIFLVLRIIGAIITKAIMAVPGAIVLTAEEKTQYGSEIIKNLKDQGVSISEAEAQAIIEEVLANPEQLQTHINDLKQAFEAIK